MNTIIGNQKSDRTQDLKSCPFCGCSDRRRGIRRQGNNGYRVVCGRCGASGPYVTIKKWHDTKFVAQGQAIKAWNRRTDKLKEGENYNDVV
ncbi:MAG: Lar family restriction alleviation protein [Ruminococcus sp.]|nr:Lar family restriction alleviation protein [Ruminococcus sp.]